MRQVQFCGGIGTGKTTVARAIHRIVGGNLLLESYEDVAYWKKFFKNPSRFSLEKNSNFIFSHAELLSESSTNEPSVCDFSLLQDVSYAALSEESFERTWIEALFHRYEYMTGGPTVLIRTECELETQCERIRGRGRNIEQDIDQFFLSSLNQSIVQTVSKLGKDGVTVVVDTTTWPLNGSEEEHMMILSGAIESLR